jgi:hypothetical protein
MTYNPSDQPILVVEPVSSELQRVQCVLKAQFDPGALSGTYAVINGAGTQSNASQVGFSDTVKILKIFNPSTTVSIDISLDGLNDHDFIPPLGTLIVDFQTNHADWPTNGSGTLYVSKGQLLWGKTAAHATYLQVVGYR